mgnify:CR=1 FL=1
MKNEEGKNMKIGAERGTVEKKRGSRGSVAERISIPNDERRWKSHPKINEKCMQNRCAKKWGKNHEK